MYFSYDWYVPSYSYMANGFRFTSISYTRFLLQEQIYKNTQAEVYPIIKNGLRTISKLKFWLDIHGLGSWKQARYVRGRCIDSFN